MSVPLISQDPLPSLKRELPVRVTFPLALANLPVPPTTASLNVNEIPLKSGRNVATPVPVVLRTSPFAAVYTFTALD